MPALTLTSAIIEPKANITRSYHASRGQFFKQQSSGIAMAVRKSYSLQVNEAKKLIYSCTLAFMTCQCNATTILFKELASGPGTKSPSPFQTFLEANKTNISNQGTSNNERY